jgi:phospholipase C
VTTAANQLGSVEHVVVLVLENRSFDHMLGFLYSDSGNVSPTTKQPFEGLTGKESNADATGTPVPVSVLAATTPNVYFTPGADPGEGFVATNEQLFGEASPPNGTSATNSGFVTDFAET